MYLKSAKNSIKEYIYIYGCRDFNKMLKERKFEDNGVKERRRQCPDC